MNQLQFYNTLTRNLETFTPPEEGPVKIYTCGPTVYDNPHVGNWVAYIYWDVLVRTLKANNLEIERVMNVTDVGHLTDDADDGEDKLEKGARREQLTAWDVAAKYTEVFINGTKQLNILPPNHLTKATEFIPQQLELVRTLKDKGYTYQIDDGIYFDTSKFPSYRDFAGLDIEALQAGARVAFNSEKRYVSDFALWKFTPEGQKRDMEWETPADLLDNPSSTPKMGFPGWHLECSAMSMDILGDTLDIHTGGIDHIPVHHTNEIAQSEAATGKKFSRFWLHNNHLKVDGAKISKSLGNGYTLEDLQEQGFSPSDFRMFVLQSSYQSEGNFSFDSLEAAANRLNNWRRAAAIRHQTHGTHDQDKSLQVPQFADASQVISLLNNNLNTPEALAHIDRVVGSILDIKNPELIDQKALINFFETVDEVLGLNILPSSPDIDDETKQLILERKRAREDKDWARSDQLRDELASKGITVRDTTHGTIWEYTKHHN